MTSSASLPSRINYKVRILPAAERDFARVFSYIAKDNPQAAARFFHKLRQKVQTLRWSPQRCARIPEKIEGEYEYRHLLVKRYRIIFCIIADTVWVMRILHGAQLLDAESLLFELK